MGSKKKRVEFFSFLKILHSQKLRLFCKCEKVVPEYMFFFFPLYSLIGDFWKAILKGLFIEPVWEISHILDFENRTYVFARKE